ncbi:hypothetical protein WJX84_008797 [Apatococcus fuscideae]|uniref:Exoribonuclease phosphorolytic domain-containing protein n=1 Tax=Apatococcus fuscideae TaxID=2026836 RepID=A0AAW1T6S1_9CHLO
MRRAAWQLSKRSRLAGEQHCLLRAAASSSTGLCRQVNQSEGKSAPEKVPSVNSQNISLQSSVPARPGPEANAPIRSPGRDDIYTAKADIQGNSVVFETGHLAAHAAGACTLTTGNTQILGTVSFQPHDGQRFREHLDQFEVEYVEGMPSVGRLPSSGGRRESMGEREIAARQSIVRALRPLFPSGFTHGCKVLPRFRPWAFSVTQLYASAGSSVEQCLAALMRCLQCCWHQMGSWTQQLLPSTPPQLL